MQTMTLLHNLTHRSEGTLIAGGTESGGACQHYRRAGDSGRIDVKKLDSVTPPRGVPLRCGGIVGHTTSVQRGYRGVRPLCSHKSAVSLKPPTPCSPRVPKDMAASQESMIRAIDPRHRATSGEVTPQPSQ